VGSRLVEKLLQEGYSVTCLVRESSDTRFLQSMPVRLVAGDLENAKALQDGVHGIDTVYHVAGAIKAANREQYFRINQTGTCRLLEALTENNPGLTRFIHVSSLAAAGPSPSGRGLRENENPNPISWYGESKLKSEEEALKYADAFRVTILRPSAVYGPRDRETLLIFRMIKRGCLLTPGRVIRRFSLVHVDDLTDALIRAGNQNTRSGEVFYISRPESYTWTEVGHAIARELGKKYRSIAFPASIAAMAGFAGDLWSYLSCRPATVNSQKVKELLQPSWLCDPSKATAGLGFVPDIDLEEGISGTVRWYREHGWL
jgi:nucleoside-diphosphate-sugar epimerase